MLPHFLSLFLFLVSDAAVLRYRHDAALRRHFAKAHFLCEHAECKHKPPDYAAFRDAISLRAHQLAAHVEKGSLSQAQLRQMARVDLNVGFFDSRLPESREAGGGGGGGGGRGGRGRRGEEEFNGGGREGPSYAVDDEDGGEEQYPVLQPSAIEQRARVANENIAERSKQEKKDKRKGGPSNGLTSASSASSSSSSSGVSMQRSYSQPYGLAGKKFDQEDFPSLAPTATSPSPFPAPLAPTRSAVIAPPASDFPTLQQTVKTDKKLRALKDRTALDREPAGLSPAQPSAERPSYGSAAIRVPPPRSASTSPIPQPATSSSASSQPYIDPRTVTHVPMPLPAPVPAEEVAVRNRALIAAIKQSLSADDFDSFRVQSSAYRAGDLTASSYLDFFYRLMDYPQRSGDVERLLLELIALLPDEAKRKELHSAYATQMVWQKLNSMKATTAPPPSVKARTKATIQSNRGGSTSMVSAPFEGVSVRALKSGEEERREREERERAERELKEAEFERKKEERRRAEEDAKKDKQEKLRLLREERLKSEAENEKREREKKERAEREQREADARAEEQRQRERDKEEADAAAARSERDAGKEKPGRTTAISSSSSSSQLHAGTMWTSARKDEEDDEGEDDIEPAFPSSTYAASTASTPLADPALLDVYLANIDHLRSVLPSTMLAPLHFLADLLHLAHSMLVHRHPPSIASPALRRFHPTDDTRKRLLSLTSRLRYSSLLEFGRLAQLGVLPTSIYSLHSAVTQWRRFDGEAGGRAGQALELVHDWMTGVLKEMTSGELVLLYEYLHRLLGAVTLEGHPDVQGAIERARGRAGREREIVVEERDGSEKKLVLLRRDGEESGGTQGGGGAGNKAQGELGGNDGAGEEGGGGGGKKKKKEKKTLLFYGGAGLSGTT